MITESITPANGTCSHCQRADVPCLELGCSERDEGHRSVYSIRLELRVVVCMACLDAARVKRDVRRTRFDEPKLPVVPATCGVCVHYLPLDIDDWRASGWCSPLGKRAVTGGDIKPREDCPKRKGAA